MRAAAWCGTVTGYWWHKGMGEPVCESCWFARAWHLEDLRLAPARRRILAGALTLDRQTRKATNGDT